MKRTGYAAVLACVLAAASAAAGTPYVLGDGINRAPAVTLHCKTAGTVVVPCGVAAAPLVVTATSGADQTSAAALGTPGDASYGGGSGTVVGLLKAVWSALTGGVTALPVAANPVSRSLAVVAQQSTTLFPANAGRHYLAFQAPQGSAIWVNMVGGAAAPNAVDCAYFAAGTLYESGPFVTRGAVTIYTPVAVTVAAWEG